MHQAEIERLASERLKNLEHGSEQLETKSVSVEKAREQLRQAEQVRPAAEAASTAEPAAAAPKVLTKTANFRHTMTSLQHRMKPAARSFSKFIHTPTVESVSEVAGKTVLRPSVTLGATTTAVLVAGFLYFFDRHYGFVLRGSEIWLTLLLGAVVGLIIEGLGRLLRRWRQR
jgi:hypothetical protein